MAGEIGGSAEEEAAEYIAEQRHQAGRRLHRRLHGAARQDDGPRGRDRLRHRRHRRRPSRRRSRPAACASAARRPRSRRSPPRSPARWRGDASPRRSPRRSRRTCWSASSATCGWTRSPSPTRGAEPSTPGQLDLGRLLVGELARDRARGRRASTTAASCSRRCPATARVIGLLAHVDTTPGGAPARASSRSSTAATTAARSSCRAAGRCSTRRTMPVLAGKAGHDIVTASGDTLLGADDKAGRGRDHGRGRAPRRASRAAAADAAGRLHARRGDRPRARRGSTSSASARPCAYTLDGSQPGELQDETLLARSRSRSPFTASTSTRAGRPASSSTPRALAGRFLAALPSDS